MNNLVRNYQYDHAGCDHNRAARPAITLLPAYPAWSSLGWQQIMWVYNWKVWSSQNYGWLSSIMLPDTIIKQTSPARETTHVTPFVLCIQQLMSYSLAHACFHLGQMIKNKFRLHSTECRRCCLIWKLRRREKLFSMMHAWCIIEKR